MIERKSLATEPTFKIDELTLEEQSSLKSSRVWESDCPIPINRLRIVKLSYWNFEGKEQADGQIMVMDAVGDSVVQIFKTLYEKKFPLAKVRLMDHYEGDDAKSLNDNNTSCFNFRPIIGSTKLSLHGYGLAIDINPIQNPFIEFPENETKKSIAIYSPPEGRQYTNRLQSRPGKPFRPGMAEQVIDIFKKNGFTVWGGDWDIPIDYQHFQVTRDVAEKLIILPPQEAKIYFQSLL